jgi:hypothetical protein
MTSISNSESGWESRNGGVLSIYRAGVKRRDAWQSHKRLSYSSINSIKVYCTSLDHLLLGMDADIDWNVDWPDYKTISANRQSRFRPPRYHISIGMQPPSSIEEWQHT